MKDVSSNISIHGSMYEFMHDILAKVCEVVVVQRKRQVDSCTKLETAEWAYCL